MTRSALATALLLFVSCKGVQRLPVDAGTGNPSDSGGDDRGSAGDTSPDTAADTGDGPSPITEDAFCGLKAEQECQVVPRCATVTMSACVAQRKSLCLDDGGRAQSDTRRFRPENAAACIDKTAAVYAKSVITPADLAAMIDVCGYVYQGDVALLGACTTKYDCNSATMICDKELCSDRVIKPTGSLCSNPGETCATGAYCAPMSAGVSVCLERATAGSACDATRPCLESLRCATTCMDRVAAGQSCSSNDDCTASAPFCDPFASSRCDLGLTFAAGAPSCSAYGG